MIRIPQPVPLHAVPSSTPVPHWVVLMVAVPLLWVGIACGVLVVDRMFEWAARIE